MKSSVRINFSRSWWLPVTCRHFVFWDSGSFFLIARCKSFTLQNRHVSSSSERCFSFLQLNYRRTCFPLFHISSTMTQLFFFFFYRVVFKNDSTPREKLFRLFFPAGWCHVYTCGLETNERSTTLANSFVVRLPSRHMTRLFFWIIDV